MAGQLSSDRVVGRARVIDRIWRALQKKSLRFTAERRIGKTTIMKKMAAEPRPGWRVMFIDLEAISSAEKFAEELVTRMRPWMSVEHAGKTLFHRFLETVGGSEIAGVFKLPEFGKLGWKATLEKAFEGIFAHLHAGRSSEMLLFLFDELPYMLQKISFYDERRGSQENSALEILDTLRELQGRFPQLRMVFAGSVGLHHVLHNIRGADFAAESLNDMPLVEIAPLDSDDAIQLSSQLLDFDNVRTAGVDRESVVRCLAESTDGVPFYMERVVSQLADLERPVTTEDIRRSVRRHLTDDHDHWEMEHFRSRLRIYYPGEMSDAGRQPVAMRVVASAVLDILATATEPHTVDRVWQKLRARLPLTERQEIPGLLGLLVKDHYLISDEEKRYSFRFPLIRTWWILAQGLNS